MLWQWVNEISRNAVERQRCYKLWLTVVSYCREMFQATFALCQFKHLSKCHFSFWSRHSIHKRPNTIEYYYTFYSLLTIVKSGKTVTRLCNFRFTRRRYTLVIIYHLYGQLYCTLVSLLQPSCHCWSSFNEISSTWSDMTQL